jgi:hypothetical protein
MPRKPTTKRPSPVEHTVNVSDHTRKAVPTVPVVTNLASYVITPLGHVFRCDGRLVLPYHHGNRPEHRAQLSVSLNNGRHVRSLPRLVFFAFGHPRLIERWRDRSDLHSYVPWIDPEGPLDPLTGRTRCTVHDVLLVPVGELSARVRYQRPLQTCLSILSLP